MTQRRTTCTNGAKTVTTLFCSWKVCDDFSSLNKEYLECYVQGSLSDCMVTCVYPSLISSVFLLSFLPWYEVNLFHMTTIQGRKPYLGEFMEYIFNICLCLDTDEQISFEFGMMIGIKLCSLIPV